PTRRAPKKYDSAYSNGAGGYHAVNANPVPGGHPRSDYAINSGDYGPTTEHGPGSDSGVVYPNWWDSNNGSQWRSLTGVSYIVSEVQSAKITDGLSNTYLVGEKYLEPENYYNGVNGADNTSMYQGYDWDVNRWGNASILPYQDRKGLSLASNFGS